ncbi:GNAT family N-acetyltransferase [Micromonospora deserti]|uniref:GNAT family N-acetyltransferase n=1 Tax=Micromonospora deserti TaxID=2070366 RepID=A0A2W2C6M2_9ACTN|nr:GNAT family N-acetyltransferase [Micromonospora deserti]PZF95081.1 GNAT family N-acetyltransferase [Micromonospora deserti]
MSDVRRAGVADAEELIRLRGLMLAAVRGREPAPGPWQEHALRLARAQLGDPDGPAAAFVVDAPDLPGGLVACAYGVIENRLGGPDNPTGQTGYVYNVVTEPAHRRRGHSRACLLALLDWYRDRGVRRVDLRASPDGAPLYRQLGFRPASGTAMRLAVPAAGPLGG